VTDDKPQTCPGGGLVQFRKHLTTRSPKAHGSRWSAIVGL